MVDQNRYVFTTNSNRVTLTVYRTLGQEFSTAENNVII